MTTPEGLVRVAQYAQAISVQKEMVMRSEGDRLRLTQEFLASMLGSRRAGVSMAMGSFGEKGMIEMTRGSVTVRDRAALEAAANGLYGVPEGDFKRMFA